MTEATGIAAYQETLERLGQGDLVTPVESLRQSRHELTSALEAGIEKRSDDPFSDVSEQVELFLARALPIIDHAGARGAQAAVTELQVLLLDEGPRDQLPDAPLRMVILHHLIWTVAAFALACDREDVLVRVGSLQFTSRYTDKVFSVFELSDLRHLEVFNRGADDAFRHWVDWFAGSSIRSEIASFATDRELEALFSEAELLTALCGAEDASPEQPVYCHAAADPAAMRRLSARLYGIHRDEFARLFHCDPGSLDASVKKRVESIQGPRRF